MPDRIHLLEIRHPLKPQREDRQKYLIECALLHLQRFQRRHLFSVCSTQRLRTASIWIVFLKLLSFGSVPICLTPVPISGRKLRRYIIEQHWAAIAIGKKIVEIAFEIHFVPALSIRLPRMVAQVSLVPIGPMFLKRILIQAVMLVADENTQLPQIYKHPRISSAWYCVWCCVWCHRFLAACTMFLNGEILHWELLH